MVGEQLAKKIMKAELKRIHSPDIENLSEYSPEHSDKFSFLLQAIVGPLSEEGEESFDIEVCTPKWLSENYSKDDIIIGRHLLIVFDFNYERIFSKIKSYIENCSGDTWGKVAEQIGRLGKWEFEDYME